MSLVSGFCHTGLKSSPFLLCLAALSCVSGRGRPKHSRPGQIKNAPLRGAYSSLTRPLMTHDSQHLTLRFPLFTLHSLLDLPRPLVLGLRHLARRVVGQNAPADELAQQ